MYVNFSLQVTTLLVKILYIFINIWGSDRCGFQLNNYECTIDQKLTGLLHLHSFIFTHQVAAQHFPIKFHLNPIWNDGALGFFEEVAPTTRSRVRTILVLGDIRKYWIILLRIVGHFFFRCDTIWYQSDSSRPHPHDNHLDVCGAAIVSRRRPGDRGGDKVQAIQHVL